MNTEKLSNENETEALNKHVVMQAGSEKQPYFKLSTNEFGKHWLFYKPLKSEPGKYSCWMPIDDEFYSEFDRMLKAALGSEATVGQRSVGTGVSDGHKHDFKYTECSYRFKCSCGKYEDEHLREASAAARD